jgi:hypothetical protein
VEEDQSGTNQPQLRYDATLGGIARICGHNDRERANVKRIFLLWYDFGFFTVGDKDECGTLGS